jgi:uncharacterized protein YbjT (DUF2867 family)
MSCCRSSASSGTSAPHCDGKRAQEELVARGWVPWSIVPATMFHDFAEMMTTWTEQDGSATIAPLLIQPVAPADVADVLAEVATGQPQGRRPDLAGPEPQDLVDLARRTRAARGNSIRLVPTWSSGLAGLDMSGDVPAARPGRPNRSDHVRRLARSRDFLVIRAGSLSA